MGRLNDISLATQVAVFHNNKAFDQLVREYQSPVRRFFLTQTLGDEALSDDLSQDTFIKAYTHIAQYRGTSSFLTWITRIAYNVWYDHCRSQKVRHEELSSASCSPGTLKESASTAYTSHASLRLDLYQGLDQLKEEERVCITLQLVDGYAINEIADIVNMPTGTVKSHLKRGKEKLADYLRQNGYDR